MSSQTTARLPKAVVGDVKAVAKMLATDVASVFREYETGKLPAPFIICSQTVWRLAEIREWVAAECPDRETWERRTTKAKAQPATRKPARQNPPRQLEYDDFRIPNPGKAVFAWAKSMEKFYQTSLVHGMGNDGETEGFGRQFADWNKEQVNTICMKVMSFIRELPAYRGEFEYLFKDRTAHPPWEAEPA